MTSTYADVSDLNFNVNCMQMRYEHTIVTHMQMRGMQMICEYADEFGRMDITLLYAGICK